MFRPSDPNDKNLTSQEFQDWEHERDSKKDDFPFIQLRKPELKLLKAVAKKEVEITEKNKTAALRLRDMVLIRTMRTDSPCRENIEFCQIRKRGENYLMYIRGIQGRQRNEMIRYVITTTIAILALVLAGISLAAQLGLVQLPPA